MAAVRSTGSEVVRIRNVQGEDTINITFTREGRTHAMLRSKAEALSKTLKRIFLTILKGRKRKKHQSEPSATASPQLKVHLFSTNLEEVAHDIPNHLAWKDGCVLAIGVNRYTVRVNMPTVLQLKLPECIMAGCPVVPQIELEFANTCTWLWKREAITATLPKASSSTSHLPEQLSAPSFVVVNTSFVYWPTKEDCGHQLKVECIPANSSGREGEVVSVSTLPVREGPKSSPIAKRHQLTAGYLSSPGAFRFVSYNILADIYATSDHAREVLYPYCHPEALNIDYRQNLIVHELLGYHADIVCLQETGTRLFNGFLLPVLKQRGYDGCYQAKGSQAFEGEAILFNTAAYSLEYSKGVALGEFLQSSPLCDGLYKGLQAVPFVLQEAVSKHTIVLVALFRNTQLPEHFLCVANTHLYFHPKGDLIRLIQIETCLQFVRSILDEFSCNHPTAEIATLFCGDLNSCPCIAAYHYMITGSVGRQHPDWMLYKQQPTPRCRCGCNYTPPLSTPQEEAAAAKQDAVWPSHPSKLPRTEADDDEFEGLDLQHNFNFENACGIDGYTNYTSIYKGILDYIFYDADRLSVERIVPFPSHEEVTEFVALPSIHFPSDHLALVADLKWRTQ